MPPDLCGWGFRQGQPCKTKAVVGRVRAAAAGQPTARGMGVPANRDRLGARIEPSARSSIEPKAHPPGRPGEDPGERAVEDPPRSGCRSTASTQRAGDVTPGRARPEFLHDSVEQSPHGRPLSTAHGSYRDNYSHSMPDSLTLPSKLLPLAEVTKVNHQRPHESPDSISTRATRAGPRVTTGVANQEKSAQPAHEDRRHGDRKEHEDDGHTRLLRSGNARHQHQDEQDRKTQHSDPKSKDGRSPSSTPKKL
ncbi:hypothetical protein EV384_5379 [Micromonospora kangleipakensis]|uniref:Uncharacterized protein n=1 Tax=Micromonospora kangleipakensis TaxID=1077942 RepID=A0A4Q8BGX1_9ACTN|nr:hypothetical protein EV384_5379 [Micromonospora kangleipakensis]